MKRFNRMKVAEIQQRIKPWMMPVAIVLGILFHQQINILAPVVPYLIFTMLFITFCRIDPTHIRVSAVMWQLLAVQIVGAVLLFIGVRPLGIPLAQAVFICVFCPTATAAPVVTGMLGGDIGKVATYSIISNLAVAVLAPVLFIWFGREGANVGFFTEFGQIAAKVAPLIFLPLVCAFLLRYFLPGVHSAVRTAQGISFYLWSISLIIVVGRAVSFVFSEPAEAIPMMVSMALGAALVCLLQFFIGRKLGARAGDRISAAQSLGQKNTVLAIWLALTYLDPISSVGPAAYIVWQNSFNSLQIYYYMKTQRHK